MQMQHRKKIIALVGGIAVGKTTIGNEICKGLGDCRFIEEDVSKNLFLPEFYGDMKRYGFHSRISTLAMIASNYMNWPTDTHYILMDRCIDEVISFAKLQYENGNMNDKEYKVYYSLYKSLVEFAPKIDIYCHCDATISYERIKKRNRIFEQSINIEYIEKVNKYYLEWLKSIEAESKNIIYINTCNNVNINDILDIIKE